MAPRMAPELQEQMSRMAAHEEVSVIVRRRRDRPFESLATSTRSVSRNRFRLFSGEAVMLTAAEVNDLSQNDDIEDVWLDLPVQAWLDTSVPLIEAPQVWNAGLRGQGIKVAVLDTGIDVNYPDFAGRIAATESFVDDTPQDMNGHGTHVAGIIAGNGARSQGKYTGVAPEASLYIGKVLDNHGVGSMSAVMAGIEWAVLEQRVQIINLSLGGRGPTDGTDALSVLCDEAVTQAGVVICVAAGNTGPRPQTIGPPGGARYVITVGAIDDAQQIARFSARGPTSDSRIKPDVVFPGVGIVAPQAEGTQLGAAAAPGYVTSNGTSMAAPHAAGVAALLLQANPNLSAEQVKVQLLAGAKSLGFPTAEQGVGLGNALRSYQVTVRGTTSQLSREPVTPPVRPQPTHPEPQPDSQAEKKGCLASLLGNFGR